jgi:hypothetical protein
MISEDRANWGKGQLGTWDCFMCMTMSHELHDHDTPLLHHNACKVGLQDTSLVEFGQNMISIVSIIHEVPRCV